MCMNRRVLIGLGFAAIAVFVVAGRGGVAFVPLFVTLACPLSMVAMMAGMHGGTKTAAACPTPPTAADRDPEVVRLRAQLAELRAEQPRTQMGTGDAQHQ